MGNEDRNVKNAHLKHLDVGNAQVQIRSIAENQAAREEETNGQDRANEHFFRHMHIPDAIEEIGCALENARTNGGETQMPCHQEDWELEIEGIVKVIVVDDDSRTQRYPDRDDDGGRKLILLRCRGRLWHLR